MREQISAGALLPGEQPGQVFVNEDKGTAPSHRRISVNLDRSIATVLSELSANTSTKPPETAKQLELLQKASGNFRLQMKSMQYKRRAGERS